MADTHKLETPAPELPSLTAPETAAPDAHPLLGMQRSAGNAAVAAMLQTKLSVGAADDPAEREADRVADEVMRSLGHDGGPVRRRGSATTDELGGQQVSPGLQSRIAASSGRSMDPTTQSAMEGAFGGASFGGVRIHDGGDADTLSRSLQADAFTTGNDVFFRKGQYDPSSSDGQELLAHELAHVVQQGGVASRSIHRFVSATDFAARTDEGTFTGKSSAQKEIEKQLAAYAKLGAPNAEGKPVIPDAKLDNAIALVTQMKTAAQLWLDAKTKDVNGVATVDPKRAKRAAGMAWFMMACDGELTALTDRRDAKGVAQDEVVVDTKGVQKLKEKYTGSLSGAMEKAAFIVGKAIANNGDSTEFELNVKIPVSPGVFVGGILRFEGKKDGNTEISLEALFQAGVDLGLGDIHGALGGYLKSSGKTPEGTMKLLSYGMYRRCKESSIIPREFSSKIWGGDSGSAGAEAAEKWSLGVEETELDDEESYVESGGVAEVGADIDAGVVEGGAAIKGTAGKRHDKKSLEKTKGGAGKKNKGPAVGRGAQKSTGRSVAGLELSMKAAVVGFGAGDVKLAVPGRDNLEGEGIELDQCEIQVRISGRVPATGLEGAIAGLVTKFASSVRTVASKEFAQAEGAAAKAKKLALPAVSLGKAGAETALQDLEGIGVTDAIKRNTIDQLLAPSPSSGGGEAASGGLSPQSQIGLELAFNLSETLTSSTSTFEIRNLSAMSVKLPSVLQAELVRRSRLLGWRNQNGGGWTLI